MTNWTNRKVAFVVVATDHGPMIVNRFDYRMVDETHGYGVGFDLLETSSFSPNELDLAISLLELRRRYFGDGVVAIDCGANIGVHTIEWARRMGAWGSVISIEAQERIFYALAGNIALNNCFNAQAIWAAVGGTAEPVRVPKLDHARPSSFGSVALKPGGQVEFVGQAIDYSSDGTTEVRCIPLDLLGLKRVDFIKVDVEGMELDVLAGAREILRRAKPIVVVEFIKSDKTQLRSMLQTLGYRLFELRMDLLAIHQSDKALDHISAAK